MTESLTELDTVCQKDPEALLTVSETGGQDLFFQVMTGELPLSAQPPIIRQDDLITAQFKAMRDYSAAEDAEQHSGIYRAASGEYYILTEPSVGGWNQREHYYFAGPISQVAGHKLVVDIHSHPPGKKFNSVPTRVGLNPEDERLAGSLLPSYMDSSDLLLVPREEVSTNIKAAIVVGQGLCCAMVRTKETALKKERVVDHRWIWVEVLNGLMEIESEVGRGHPDWDALSKKLLAVGKTCQENNLAWYLMGLKPTGENSDLWVRFNPWPENLNEAIELLLS